MNATNTAHRLLVWGQESAAPSTNPFPVSLSRTQPRTSLQRGARQTAMHWAVLLVLVLIPIAPAFAHAADAACASVLRHAVVETLRTKVPGVSRGILRHAACRLDDIALEGLDPNLGSGQRGAIRSALCSGEISRKGIRSLRNVLATWLSTDSLVTLQACLHLAARGMQVELAVSDDPETTVDIVVASLRRLPAPLVPVVAGAEALAAVDGSFRISGSPEWIAGGLQETSLPEVLASATKGVRLRLLAQPLIASFSAPGSLPEGSLGLLLETGFGPLPIAVTVGPSSAILEQALINVIGGEAPTIPGCVDFQGDPTVKRCTSIPSYQACLAELVSSTVRDCRADIPPSPSSLIIEEPIDPAAQSSVTSTLHLSVNQALRGSATASGAGTWEVLVPTPTRPAATNCDESCPIGPEPTCSRGCVIANAWREPITGAAGGLFSISTLAGSGCTSATLVTGTAHTDAMDSYRAWEACERDSAWGSSTSIDLIIRAGKLFQFQDPHTTHVGSVWTWRSDAEVLKQVMQVHVPVTVECRRPVSAL